MADTASGKRPTKKEIYQAERLVKVTEKCDWGRQVDACQEDPRWTGWPCNGQHASPPNYSGNAHGAWKHCAKCDIRLMYIPFHGSPSTHVKQANNAHVELAQRELMYDLPMVTYVDARMFHKKIDEIALRYKQQRGPRSSSRGAARTDPPVNPEGPRGSGHQTPATAVPKTPQPNGMHSAAAASSEDQQPEAVREPRAKRATSRALSARAAGRVQFMDISQGPMATKRSAQGDGPQSWPAPVPMTGIEAVEAKTVAAARTPVPSSASCVGSWYTFAMLSWAKVVSEQKTRCNWMKFTVALIKKRKPGWVKKLILELALAGTTAE
jgi:hypothetical protein